MAIDTAVLPAHLSVHKRSFSHGLERKVFYYVGSSKDHNAAEDRTRHQVDEYFWMAFDVGGYDYGVYLK